MPNMCHLFVVLTILLVLRMFAQLMYMYNVMHIATQASTRKQLLVHVKHIIYMFVLNTIRTTCTYMHVQVFLKHIYMYMYMHVVQSPSRDQR